MKKLHIRIALFAFGLAIVLGFGVSKVSARAVSGVNTSGNYMFRLYNPNSGEHFYTQNVKEEQELANIGWKFEGVGWIAPRSGAPVYRLYNPNAGDHFYTTNAAEKNSLVKNHWRYEGIGWYSGGKTALYRAYNPNASVGTHNYTTNIGEENALVRAGWRNENIAWYGVAPGFGAAAGQNWICNILDANKNVIAQRIFTTKAEANDWGYEVNITNAVYYQVGQLW